MSSQKEVGAVKSGDRGDQSTSVIFVIVYSTKKSLSSFNVKSVFLLEPMITKPKVSTFGVENVISHAILKKVRANDYARPHSALFVRF